jgi:hypothetical protein
MTKLDHLVIAARTLEEGSDYLQKLFQTSLAPGGQHLGYGTHNRLLRLGTNSYLELIALDPSQPNPGKPAPFGLGTEQIQNLLAFGPKLIAWVARTEGLVTLMNAHSQLPVGQVVTMQRGQLQWLITQRVDGQPVPDGLPTLIDWGSTTHPCTRLPNSPVRLKQLKVQATQLGHSWLRNDFADASVLIEGPVSAPSLQAHFSIELDSKDSKVIVL